MLFYNPSLGYIKLHVNFLEWCGFLYPLATSNRFFKFRVLYHYLNNLIIFLGILSTGLYCLHFYDELQRSSLPLYFFFTSTHHFTCFLSINVYYKTFRGVVETTVNDYFDEHVKSEQDKPRIIKHTKFIQRLFYGNQLLYVFILYFLFTRELDATYDERPLAIPIDFFMKNRIHLYGYYILLTLSFIIVLSIGTYAHGSFMFNFAILM